VGTASGPGPAPGPGNAAAGAATTVLPLAGHYNSSDIDLPVRVRIAAFHGRLPELDVRDVLTDPFQRAARCASESKGGGGRPRTVRTHVVGADAGAMGPSSL
jgi:hypothetical protein